MMTYWRYAPIDVIRPQFPGVRSPWTGQPDITPLFVGRVKYDL